MNQHDRDLLEKQFRSVTQRDGGAGIWAGFAVLFAGLAIAGLVYVYEAPAHVASQDGTTLTASLNQSQPAGSQL